ncbi:MAG: magnesium/cobalt transporter CorA [Notoacmeibacter sp.]|nr:magnesium/cobalt transporter CorA [Notoacmeibacter sp.]MCC0032286.1 magnesium/cobalt transporter CorA [Brucellaceae bacterium]
MARHGKKKRSIVTRRRTPAGAPPGTLIHDPERAGASLSMITWSTDGLEETSPATPTAIRAALKAGQRIWVDVAGTGDAGLVAELGDVFGIDPLALEDVMNLHQRPKAEEFDTFVFVVLHMVDGREAASREQFSLLFSRNWVLTFQETPGDCLDPVRDRLRRGKPRICAGGPDYLAYAILDAILDAYFPVAEKLGDRLETLEDAITLNPAPADIAELHAVKRDLLSVKRSLWPMREMMSVLRDGDIGLVTDETRRFLRDVHDHVLQLIDIVETYRELASGLLDLYLSSLSNRMNEVMKVLTIISTIFIPLSFLAGVWGMNFHDMPELHAHWGYPAALGFMAAVAVTLLAVFRWRKWL